MKKIGIALTELLTASMLLSVATFATFGDFNVNGISHQNTQTQRLNIIKNITSNIRQAAYIHESDYEVIIPTKTSFTHVFNAMNAIAFIIKNTQEPSSYSGIVYSIIPEYEWNGGDSEKFVMIKTIIEKIDKNESSDENIIDWSSGKSFIIADNLKPAYFKNMKYNTFIINSANNMVDFAMIAKSDGLYFPSYYGWKNIDDSDKISSVVPESNLSYQTMQ